MINFHSAKIMVCLVLVLAVLLGCAGNHPVLMAPAPEATAYKLGSGDTLRIRVFNEPGLSGDYGLSAAGNVAFPLIGLVHADGKSVEQLQTAIVERLLAGFLSDPKVSVEVIVYRPYYILGEVARPGAFPFAVGLTLDQAVAAAGGFTYRANHRRAFIRRPGDQTEFAVDLRSGPVRIGPGDTIRIGERYF